MLDTDEAYVMEHDIHVLQGENRVKQIVHSVILLAIDNLQVPCPYCHRPCEVLLRRKFRLETSCEACGHVSWISL